MEIEKQQQQKKDLKLLFLSNCWCKIHQSQRVKLEFTLKKEVAYTAHTMCLPREKWWLNSHFSGALMHAEKKNS